QGVDGDFADDRRGGAPHRPRAAVADARAAAVGGRRLAAGHPLVDHVVRFRAGGIPVGPLVFPGRAVPTGPDVQGAVGRRRIDVFGVRVTAGVVLAAPGP